MTFSLPSPLSLLKLSIWPEVVAVRTERSDASETSKLFMKWHRFLGGVYMIPVRVSFWYELSISYRVYMDDTNIDTGMTHEPKQ